MQDKNNNLIISEWRNFTGECSAEKDCTGFESYEPEHCLKCTWYTGDYSTSPSAWTPELYAEIEDKGLSEMFIYKLERPRMMGGNHRNWFYLTRTPEQKAIALAQAIEDTGC